MCFDPKFKRIYVFGRYVDPRNENQYLNSDFYYYDINNQKWSLISCDTNVLILFFSHLIFIEKWWTKINL